MCIVTVHFGLIVTGKIGTQVTIQCMQGVKIGSQGIPPVRHIARGGVLMILVLFLLPSYLGMHYILASCEGHTTR